MGVSDYVSALPTLTSLRCRFRPADEVLLTQTIPGPRPSGAVAKPAPASNFVPDKIVFRGKYPKPFALSLTRLAGTLRAAGKSAFTNSLISKNEMGLDRGRRTGCASVAGAGMRRSDLTYSRFSLRTRLGSSWAEKQNVSRCVTERTP